MSIVKRISVPTGDILIVKTDSGYLECLSLYDYGQEKNVKADFLGLIREIDGVPNGALMPLTKKWVVTISTQYGCAMKCAFCDAQEAGNGKNASVADLRKQVNAALDIHPEINWTRRLNIHFARMGEPTFNPNVLEFSRNLYEDVFDRLGGSLIHPVVSTMMPGENKNLEDFLAEWCDIKNNLFHGNAGLQISVNSTDDKQREFLFGGNALSLVEISKIVRRLPMPKGRKYALNFALADDSIVDGRRLAMLFSPDKCMVKITPMHITKAVRTNNLVLSKGYVQYAPYKKFEEDLKMFGFDVLVFIPSIEEDEGRITCGNALLGDPDIKEFISTLSD